MCVCLFKGLKEERIRAFIAQLIKASKQAKHLIRDFRVINIDTKQRMKEQEERSGNTRPEAGTFFFLFDFQPCFHFSESICLQAGAHGP